MTTHAPERSLVQRLEALQRANDIRSRRAELKRGLKAGHHDIVNLVLEPPAYLETAKVFDLLLATPKWGRVKVNKALGKCHISPSKTVGGLSERQRRELATYIRCAPTHIIVPNRAAGEHFARRMGTSV